MQEFVERGLIKQIEAPFRFTTKSKTEMVQLAYQFVATGDSSPSEEDPWFVM